MWDTTGTTVNIVVVDDSAEALALVGDVVASSNSIEERGQVTAELALACRDRQRLWGARLCRAGAIDLRSRHHEAGQRILDGLGRREAAGCHPLQLPDLLPNAT
jgi:hypothetical protein